VCPRNRGVVDGSDFAGELPDVMVGSIPVMINEHFTDSFDFHFVPASVHQLLETALFKRVSDAVAQGSTPEAVALATRLGVTQKDIDALNAFYTPVITKPGIIDNLWVLVPALPDTAPMKLGKTEGGLDELSTVDASLGMVLSEQCNLSAV
jgi:hypothetical protein